MMYDKLIFKKDIIVDKKWQYKSLKVYQRVLIKYSDAVRNLKHILIIIIYANIYLQGKDPQMLLKKTLIVKTDITI